jgi:hypothetical protein
MAKMVETMTIGFFVIWLTFNLITLLQGKREEKEKRGTEQRQKNYKIQKLSRKIYIVFIFRFYLLSLFFFFSYLCTL